MNRLRRIYLWDPGFWRCALVLVVMLGALQGRKLVQGRSIARLDMFCDDALWRENWCISPITPLQNADYSPAMVNYPYEWWNAQQLRRGHLPAWNPMVGAGQPSRVTFQGAALNPMRLPFYLHPTVRTHDFSLMLQVFVAGIFAFLLARRLGAGDEGGLLAALAYAFSGFLSSYIAFSLAAAAAVLPALLYAIERLVTERTTTTMIGCGLAFAMGATLGHPSTNFLLPQAGVLWLAARSVPLLWRRQWREAGRLALLIGGAAIICVAVVAAAWIGLVELLHNGYTYKNEVRGEGLINGARERYLPLFKGGLVAPRALEAFRNNNDQRALYPHFVSPYMGIATIGLALWAWSARRMNAALVVFALWAVAIIYGPGPLHRLNDAPGYEKIYFYYCSFLLALPVAIAAGLGLRAVGEWARRERWGWLPPIVIAVLGLLFVLSLARAFGHAHLPAQREVWKRWVVAEMQHWHGVVEFFPHVIALVGVATLLALVRPLRRYAAVPVLCVLVMGDLVWNTAVTRERALRFDLEKSNPPAVKLLREGLPRVPGQGRITGTDWRAPAINGASVMGLRDLRETDALQIARYTQFMKSLDSLNNWNFPTLRVTTRWQSALVDVGAVRYIVKERLMPADHWKWRRGLKKGPPELQDLLENDPDRPLIFSNDSVAIYENKRALPRAFLVGQATCVQELATAMYETVTLARADAVGKNVANTVVVERAPDGTQPPPLDDGSADRGGLSWTLDDADDLELVVDAPAPRYLVLSDTFYPGWRALLDGKRTGLFAADMAFRAVYVPTGHHVVRFEYRPTWRKVENWLSLPALLASCVAWVVLVRRNRRGYRLKANPKLASRLAVN